MKDNQNEHNMGEQIMDALSDALQSGNFTDLNRLVTQSVTTALNEVGKHIQFAVNEDAQDRTSHFSPYADNEQADNHQEAFREQARQQSQTYRQQTERQAGQQEPSGRQSQNPTWQQTQDHTWQQAQDHTWQQAPNQAQQRAQDQARRQDLARQRAKEQARRQELARQRAKEQARRQEQARQSNPSQQFPSAPRQTDSTAILPYEFKRVGKVSNVLYKVFGGIGLGATILTTFFHFTLLLTNEVTSLAGWIINVIFLVLFAGMIRLGIGQHRRLKLAERYAGLCGRKLYGDIEHLAKNTGRKARRVIKDLQKMMKIGMFPEGHLDDQKTCFMLSDGIYRQYLETENNRRLREEESRKNTARTEHKTAESESNPGQTPNLSEQETELNAMIAEGMECIHKLHVLNDKIPGEVISAKLFRLENLLRNIFDSVEEHPEQMHRMHKLMNYYLPTTLKLVEAYEEFDRLSVPGDDIIAAKAEIENTLDTINQAFSELLNNLFQDAVLDATTDAQVLKTMLAREGLMNEMDLS